MGIRRSVSLFAANQISTRCGIDRNTRESEATSETVRLGTSGFKLGQASNVVFSIRLLPGILM